MSKLIPLGDRLLVKQDKPDEVSVGGIVIPDIAQKKSQTGLVVAVGNGHLMTSGAIVPLSVEVGNRVIFSAYAGMDVKVDDEDYLVLQEKDVLAVYV